MASAPHHDRDRPPVRRTIQFDRAADVARPATLSRSVGFAAIRYAAKGVEEHELATICARTGVILPGSLDQAVSKRKTEFVAGRFAIASAAASVGLSPGNVARGGNGAPVWPEGLVGSVSHSDGLACAIVSSAECFVSLGIDLERVGSAQAAERLRHMVSDEREWQGLADCFDDLGQRFTAIFSAKEAVYKFIHPLVRRFVDFGEVFLEPTAPDRLRARFAPTFADETGLRELVVYVEKWPGYILTFCCGKEL